MVKQLFRRASSLLLAAALLAGGVVQAIPMAVASGDTAMAGMPMEAGTAPCKNCTPEKMLVIDCGAVCVAMAAIVAPTPVSVAQPAPPAWGRTDDVVVGTIIPPDPAPPRS